MSWTLRFISITETSLLLRFSPPLHYASAPCRMPWITLICKACQHIVVEVSHSLSFRIAGLPIRALVNSCRLNPGWPVISMRFVHYSLSYRYSKICSFVNKYAFRDFVERFTFVQLSYIYLTPLWCLFFIAQYHNFWLQHHEAVYILLPQGVYEGPTLISNKALKRTFIPFIRDTLE